MRTYLFIAILSFPLILFGQKILRIDGTTISDQELSNRIDAMVENADVHGVSIQILSDSNTIYTKTLGYQRIRDGAKLNSNHNFYAASLSKPVFAFIVMKLVDEGVFDLDEPLVNYLDKPIGEYDFGKEYEGFDELQNDPRHELITGRMCLSHSSGLPNWRYITDRGINMNNPLKFEFDPGEVYSYSGEGYQLLQLTIEKLTNSDLETLAKKYVFDPLGMSMTSFTWQERFEENYAVGHYKKKSSLERRKRTELYAAGSMDTTPEDYAKFIQYMLNNGGLSDKAFNEMIRPQIQITSQQQFGPKRFHQTGQNTDIELSYGLGWGIYFTPYGKVVFKEGHIKGWEHYTAWLPELNIGIVIMTNSSNGESIFKELIEVSLGDSWLPWQWNNYIPYDE